MTTRALTEIAEVINVMRHAPPADALERGTKHVFLKRAALRFLRVFTRNQVQLNAFVLRALVAAKASLEEIDDRLTRLDGRGFVLTDDQYRAFEDVFRGEVREKLQLYPSLVKTALEPGEGQVVDLGCGRGELLSLLHEAGIEATGIDSSAAMVAHCQERGLRADQGDLIARLEEFADGSIAAITAIHVIEHLALRDLARLIQVAAAKLRPRGLLALETPNAACGVSAPDFYLDPTHVRPVHPEFVNFMMDSAGFSRRETRFLSLCEETNRLKPIDGEAGPWATTLNENFDRLNRTLYGFRDYVAIGWR